MKTLFFTLKEMGIGMLSCLLAVSVVGTVYAPVFEQNAQKAEALVAIDPADIAFDILSQIWNAYQYITNNWAQWKEKYLDGIVWTLMNAVIEEMLRSMTQWVSNGYEGQPTFLADPDGFYTGVADGVVGTYLADTSPFMKSLCSPFSVNIKYALDLTYAKTRAAPVTCTLSDMRTNITNFFEKGITFNDGGRGWNNWFKVTQDAQYNPYGTIFSGMESLSVEIDSAKEREMKSVDQSKGFLAKQNCEDVPDTVNGGVYKQCTTVTPGSVLEGQLNLSLGGAQRRVEAADEFNELLAAVFTGFVMDAFKSEGGFAGAFNPTDPNYIPRGSPNEPLQGENPLEISLETEIKYRAIQESNLALILAAEKYKEETYPPVPVYEETPRGELVIVGYEPNPCHTGELTPELKAELVRIRAELDKSAALIAQLDDLSARYDQALLDEDVNEQDVIMREVIRLQTRLHTPADVEAAQKTETMRINDLINSNTYQDIVGHKELIDRACYVFDRGSLGGD